MWLLSLREVIKGDGNPTGSRVSCFKPGSSVLLSGSSCFLHELSLFDLDRKLLLDLRCVLKVNNVGCSVSLCDWLNSEAAQFCGD